RLAVASEAVPQDVQGALETELLCERVEHGVGGASGEERFEGGPLLRLGVLQEAEDVGGEKRALGVVGGRRALLVPAGGEEPGFDRLLKGGFGVGGVTHRRPSIWPVTAAVTRAERYSLS